MTQETKPALLDFHDSYSRTLAERGYLLDDQKRQFGEQVSAYARETFSKVWGKVVEADTSIRQIIAQDSLLKYTHWRFNKLFKQVFEDQTFYAGGSGSESVPTPPDRFYMKGFSRKDELVNIILTRSSSFEIAMEDQYGIGVVIDDTGEAVAYAPRKYADRAAAINASWRWFDNFATPRQALLILVEESKNLDFKPAVEVKNKD